MSGYSIYTLMPSDPISVDFEPLPEFHGIDHFVLRINCTANGMASFHISRADAQLILDQVISVLHPASVPDPDPHDCEPECTCTRVDVDRDDASTCEFHNQNSRWNQDCRAYDRTHAPVAVPTPNLNSLDEPRGTYGSDDDAPF